MIELSLELGQTIEELENKLSIRDLVEYKIFASKRLLPNKRFELLMAQISLYQVAVAGGKSDKISDFIPYQERAEVDDLQDFMNELNFNPVNKL